MEGVWFLQVRRGSIFVYIYLCFYQQQNIFMNPFSHAFQGLLEDGIYHNVEFTPRSISSCCRKLTDGKLILERLICELEISIFISCLFLFIFFYICTKSRIKLPRDNITEAMIYK